MPFLDHYLDDNFIANSSLALCQNDLDSAIDICSYLNVPISESKLTAPSQVIVFLWIQIDSVSGVISLPVDKQV